LTEADAGERVSRQCQDTSGYEENVAYGFHQPGLSARPDHRGREAESSRPRRRGALPDHRADLDHYNWRSGRPCLKDSETSTMRNNGGVAGLRWWMPGWIRTLAVSMLTMDEPDNARLRSIVDEAFRRRLFSTWNREFSQSPMSRRLSCSLTKVGRPGRAVCAQAPAVRHLRAARPA
jgi:hypothetical protein